MDKLLFYAVIMVCSVFIASLSQVMLKKSAQKKYSSFWGEYLNPMVITAYLLFFTCTLITVYALKVVPLSLAAVLEATGYIFIGVLSFVFFKERLTKKQTCGMILIIAGIIIFSL